MQNNPFSLDFGAEPGLYIPRLSEQSKIIDTFTSKTPSSHIFLIIGARGSGKTVLMTSISHEIIKDDKWLHVDLSSEGDLLNSLATQIYKNTKAKFPKIKLDISIKGVGVTLENDDKYQDIQVDLDTMIKTLDKKGIKLLITVDEIINAKNIREFTSYYQHAIREKLPVFLIMTGLFKNIRALQNNRSQTFLKRAPKVELGSLNLLRIASKYEEVFGLSFEYAEEMAKETAGYSYAFQLLGYYTYEAGKKMPDKSVMLDYVVALEEGSYEKIWEELSQDEKRIAIAIAKADSNVTTKEIREELELNSNSFSTYQNVLKKSGVLSSATSYGTLGFELPYFREFVLRQA